MVTSSETPQNPPKIWEETFKKWSADARFEQPLKDLGVQNFDPDLRKVLVELVESKRYENYNPVYRKGINTLRKATKKSPIILNNLVDNIRAIVESSW